MAEKLGTLLTEVDGFAGDAAERLAALWITTAEEFASAAEQTGGRASLALHLGSGLEEVNALYLAVEPFLPPGVNFAEENIPVAFGALPVEGVPAPDEEPVSFAELPPAVDLHAAMPPVRWQGNRGTCVAFTTAAMREYLLGAASGDADLSEQFIYWACKEYDNYSGAGTYIQTAMSVLQQYGVCPESIWKYVDDVVAGSEGQGPPPAEAMNAALPHCIAASTQLHATFVDELRTALAGGSLVAFSVHVYESCQRPHSFHSGDLRLPLPNEVAKGGHAMCMVGYVDDETVPGGGYFLVRNSWGEAFGKDGEVAPGYGRLPYDYLRQYGIEAYTMELS